MEKQILFTTFKKINESQLHTFFIYIPNLSTGATDSTIIIMSEISYTSPEMEVTEIFVEGMLCGSYDLDMNPEEGYM